MNNNAVIDAAEKKVVFRAVWSSIYIILVLIPSIALLVWMRLDEVKGMLSDYYMKRSNFERALEISATISDSDFKNEKTYCVADFMYGKELYLDASEIFEDLDGYKDSEDRYVRCNYDAAFVLYENKSLEEALEAFVLLGDYLDSAEMQLKIKYEMACDLYDNGSYSQAVVRFLSLGEYRDSADRAYKSALAVTGDEALAREIIELGGVGSDKFGVSLQIADRRAIFTEGSIDAGAKHTVLLRSDGTVSACGDNTYGQCDVGSWKNIVQISAGAYHTVGLKKDGTVVAVGKNKDGQCDVNEWKNIKEIATGDSDTYGLTSDGTVVYTGFHDYNVIKKATGVNGIYAGSYAAAARVEGGSFVFSHKTYSFVPDSEVISVGINTGYYAVLQMNGKCVSSLDAVSRWENLSYIDAGSTAVIGVDVEGKVYSHFFRAGDTVKFPELSGVCQCAAGTEHFVFLMEDGSLAAYGDNTYGQCDVSLWSADADADIGENVGTEDGENSV